MKRVIASIHEGFLTKYRNLNTYNRAVGEQIDAILDKYSDNDGTDHLIKLYRRCSEEDKQLIYKIFDENPVPGSIDYVKSMYKQAKENTLKSSEYSEGIVDGINMLIQTGLVSRRDIE